jgi:hypothetical protein
LARLRRDDPYSPNFRQHSSLLSGGELGSLHLSERNSAYEVRILFNKGYQANSRFQNPIASKRALAMTRS